MTDLRIIDAPLPTQALTADTLGQAIDAQTPSTGRFLALSSASGLLKSSLLGRAWSDGRLTRADEDAFSTAMAEPMDEAAWRASPYFRDGLEYDPRTTPARAAMRAQIHDENAFRDYLIGTYDAGAWGQVGGFVAGMAGSMLSPENYIPFAGPALRVARAGRFGQHVARAAQRAEALAAGGIGARMAVGAGMGAFDATLGNALAMPATVAGRAYYGDDVGWAEIIQDLAFGLVGGAVLGGGFGAVGALRARRAARAGGTDLQARLPHAPDQAPQATALSDLPPPDPPLPDVRTQDGTLHALAAGAADMAQGRALDLGVLPEGVRDALVQARGRKLAAWIETPDPARTDMHAAALEFVQREATPVAAGQVLPNRGFSFGFLEDAELRALRDMGLHVPEWTARIIDGTSVRHILQKHGPTAPRQPGEAPVTVDLIARYPELIRAPLDSMSTRTDRGHPSVTYLLRDVDGALVVVEELRKRTGAMALHTMYRLPDTWGGSRLAQVSGLTRRTSAATGEKADPGPPRFTSETTRVSPRGLDAHPDPADPGPLRFSSETTRVSPRGLNAYPDPTPNISPDTAGFHLFPDADDVDFSRGAAPRTATVSAAEARAASHGFDLGDAAALDVLVTRLDAEGRAPPDLMADYHAATAAEARAQHAPAAWQAAASCILGGAA